MATNIFEIAFLMPLKSYPVTANQGSNFDDDWYYRRLFDWQVHVGYKQKIQKDDFLKVQIISTFADPTFQLYSIYGYPVGAPVTGTHIANDASGNGVYEFNLAFNTLDAGIYVGYFKATLADKTFAILTEPWDVQVKHKNTSLVRYRNSINDFGVMFTGRDLDDNPYAPEFTFRCECAVMDIDPKRDRSSYRDQVLNQFTNYAMPYRKGKLYVGTKKGVAEWVMDLFGRIICCDFWAVNNYQWETPDASEFEVTRFAGYPLVGGAIDVVPAKNLSSAQQNDAEVPGGIFASYDINTDAFGTLNAPPDSNQVILENIE